METNTSTRTHSTRTTPRRRRLMRHRAGLAALPTLAVAGVLGVAADPAVAARPSPPPITCGTVVTRDVRLTGDLLDCAGPGLVVGAKGVTIDLAGHTVDGTGIGAGIDNEAGHDGLRVRNGRITGFVFGINLFQADGARLDRVEFRANVDGIKLASSVDVDIDRTAVADSAAFGVEITFAERVTVRRSTITGNLIGGIVDRYSEGNRHSANVLAANVGPGLVVDRTGGAVVERNLVFGNDSDGIQLVGVSDATVTRNEAFFNTGHGIAIDEPGNRVAGNAVVGNGALGISAPTGTVDGGRNRAAGNAAGSCTGVTCR